MRKEVIFAIFAGISIGLIFAFGAWKVAKILKPKPIVVTKKETPQTLIKTHLVIDNYKDFDVVTEDPTIKGISTPNSDIFISTSEQDFYTKSNAGGEFELKISLPAGLSELVVTDTSTSLSQKLNLVYSTEVSDSTAAYVGTITDISSGTIQVKSINGSILQISTNTETAFVNSLKKGIEVKESDLAIGDFIVAIGTQLKNKVMNSERILITSPTAANNIKVTKIKIEKLTKTTINNITLPKKWNGPNIKDLEVDQEIYILGTENDDKTYTLRSIFIPVE